MSNQHYGYHNDGRHSQAQAEVDDLLNSLVNQSNAGYHNNNNNYYYQNQPSTGPPPLPARMDDGSHKYYYTENQNQGYPSYPSYQNTSQRPAAPYPPLDYSAPPNFPMPYSSQPVYPPQDYHRQRSPPGSPNPQRYSQGYPQQYPPHPDDYYQNRPSFSSTTSDSTLSTPSNAPMAGAGGYPPPLPPKSKRTPSHLRTIVTIERPRLEETTDANGDAFVPVSPDSDSDDGYFNGTPAPAAQVPQTNFYPPTTEPQAHKNPQFNGYPPMNHRDSHPPSNGSSNASPLVSHGEIYPPSNHSSPQPAYRDQYGYLRPSSDSFANNSYRDSQQPEPFRQPDYYPPQPPAHHLQQQQMHHQHEYETYPPTSYKSDFHPSPQPEHRDPLAPHIEFYPNNPSMKEDSQMHMEESYSGTQTTAPSGNPNIQEDPMAPKIEFYPGNQINPPARQQSLTNEPLIETFQVSSETSTLPRESSLSAAPLPPPKNSMQTQANINFNMHQQETLPEAYIKHIPKVYGIDLDHPLQKAEYYQPMSPEYQKPVEMDEEEALTRLLEHVSLEPNYALLSVLSNAFIRGVKALENVRELWCASEYNESFTGSEAVTIIKNLFKDQLPEEYCVGVANSLMRSDPPVFSPTQYSQRSLISKRMYNSEDTYFLEEDSSDGILPSGVITSATACYSYNCKPGESGCYSPCCPNLKRDYEVEEKDEINITLEAAPRASHEGTRVPTEAWSARVSRELLENIDKREIARQEIINEIIYSEEKFLSDLTVLKEVIVDGLANSHSIEASKRQGFIHDVFYNFEELIVISRELFDDLANLSYRYEGQCVPMIGDILVKHFAFFEQPFVKYSPHAQLSKYLAELEIKHNPEFDKFVKDVPSHKRTNRLPFWNYLLCPVTRMQRYPLLLSTLIKKTEDSHPDFDYLTRANDMICTIAKKADVSAASVKKRLAILGIRDSITFKQGELYDLQLSDNARILYHRGGLKRRNTELVDKHDIYGFVFDHMLILTKARKTNTGEEYRIWRRPIPLHLLKVQSASGNIRVQPSGTANSYVFPAGATTLVLQHLGQKDAVYHFYCQSLEEKQIWMKAIDDARATLRKRQGDMDIFDLRPLDDVNFRYSGASSTSTRVNCSVPFVTIRHERKTAIGTDTGVFFKTEGQDSTVRRIIQCESVVQMAVMEKYNILVVLTEKALRAYPLDVLCSNTNTKGIDRLEMEIAQGVGFFQIGVCNNRDLLVYKRKKNTASVFMALEPTCNLRDSRNEKLLTKSTSFFGTKPDYSRWFKKYQEFYVGADASNIHFLKSKLNVVCERGFEIIDPENLQSGRDIPDSEDPQFNFVTRHPEPLRPLAMYRVNDRFLLCYNKFAFSVNNRNGSLVVHGPSKLPTLCEWEGSPNQVVYHPPYIIAIDPQFIEIRHIETGEIVQIIPGENIRLAYYSGDVIHICMTHSQKPDTQALYHLLLSNNRSKR